MNDIYLRRSCSVERRLRDLISRMTVEEKCAQLCSVPIQELVENGNLSVKKMKKFLKYGIGQITRVAGGIKWLEPEKAAKFSNEIQKFLEKNTRLKIPAMIHEECLSGFLSHRATTFPQAIGFASTWDPDIVRRVTSVIRRQMRATGAHQGLAPVLDVARDPRWGRIEETLGEDPYLVACMAKAYVEGLQGEDFKTGVYATLKHFGGHSFSEGGRNCAPVHVSPRELREVFLFPFEVGVKVAGAGSVMNAYHEIDGIPCGASKELLTKILREEWGFEGFVVSDYGTLDMLVNFHRVASDKKEAAKIAIEAGIDIELPMISCYGEPLIQAVKEGLVSQATLDSAVCRVLRAKFISGIFENRYVKEKEVKKVFDTPSDRRLALQVARESMVLLKNENGLLPVKKNISSIAVIGPNARNARNMFGDYGYTAHLGCEYESVRTVTVLEGIKNKVSPKTKVLYARGCDTAGDDKSGFEEAIEAAKNAELSVLVLGGSSGFSQKDTSGEGRDASDLALPGVQEELVRAIYESGKPVVVVLIHGRPLSITWISEHIPAILQAWLPGEEGGNAIADVLFGNYNPAGRLPVSIPKTAGQIPVHYNRKPSSFGNYISMDSKALYPFGFGLSYTRFEYKNLRINPEKVTPAGKVEISVEVKNTGSRIGEEVVQLYIHDIVASVSRPLKELKGFRRISLKPGEKKELKFILSTDQLAFYDQDMNLTVEPGEFEVMLGSSSEDIRLRGKFEVRGNRRIVCGPRIFLTEQK